MRRVRMGRRCSHRRDAHLQRFSSLRCPRCGRTIANVAQPEPRETESPITHMEFLYGDSAAVTCPSCGWAGAAGDCATEVHLSAEFYDVWCPRCEDRIAKLPFATHGEIRDAAAAGNAKAMAELDDLDRVEAFHDRASASLLREPAQLPELEGDALELVWDFEPGSQGSDNITVIRHGDRELWREAAYWEGGDRFAEVFTILRRRYGWRLVRLVPSAESLFYLGGDHFTLDCRRAEAGLADVPRGASHDLELGSVTDRAGRCFHVLRLDDLIVWRAASPSLGPPTMADVQRLEGWVRHHFRGRVKSVSLEG